MADAAYPMPEGGFVDVFDGLVKKKTKATTAPGESGDAASGEKKDSNNNNNNDKLEAASRPSPPKLLLLQRIILMRVLSLFPWIRHWMQGTIFDGDGILLAGQAKRMASLEAADATKRWPQLYYMPASCDVFVTQLRKWLDREAGGGPQWAPGVEAAVGSSGAAPDAVTAASPGSREERKKVLDRRAQHVRLCTVCQKGEKQLQKARNVFMAACLFALLGLTAVVGGLAFGGGAPKIATGNRGAAAGAAAVFSVVAALSAKAASVIHWGLLPNFGFRDYVHAHKD